MLTILTIKEVRFLLFLFELTIAFLGLMRYTLILFSVSEFLKTKNSCTSQEVRIDIYS